MDEPQEPEPYRHMSRAQLIRKLIAANAEAARYRRDKAFWKARAATLERGQFSEVECHCT